MRLREGTGILGLSRRGSWTGRWAVAGASLAMVLVLLAPTPALARGALNVVANAAADESYGLGIGSSTQINPPYLGGFTQGHLVAALNNLGNASCDNGDFVYITAWSDNASTNGVLADFLASIPSSGEVTGRGPWTVCASGVDFGPGPGPTLGAINAAITTCNNGTGVAPGSLKWCGFAPTCAAPYCCGGPGWASGPANTGNPSPFSGVVPSIATGARWMWYDTTGADGLSSFTNPGPRGEFYIFRTPACSLLKTAAVSINGQYHNTGPAATSYEWTVLGNVCPLVDAYSSLANCAATCTNSVSTPAPPCDTQACSTVTWPCAIPAGSKPEFGFTVRSSNLPPPATSVTTVVQGFDPNAIVTCAHHLVVDIADNGSAKSGRFQFTNPGAAGGNCESTTLFVRNISAEWYGGDDPNTQPDNEPALVDLAPGSTRRPVGVGQGPSSAFSIPAGGTSTVKVGLAKPSDKTGHVALIYTVGTSATPDPNTDNTETLLLPVSPGEGNIPTLSDWGMITLVMLLVLAGGLMIRRRNSQAPVV